MLSAHAFSSLPPPPSSARVCRLYFPFLWPNAVLSGQRLPRRQHLHYRRVSPRLLRTYTRAYEGVFARVQESYFSLPWCCLCVSCFYEDFGFMGVRVKGRRVFRLYKVIAIDGCIFVISPRDFGCDIPFASFFIRKCIIEMQDQTPFHLEIRYKLLNWSIMIFRLREYYRILIKIVTNKRNATLLYGIFPPVK